VHSLLDWLGHLPPAGLYAALALMAAVENVFPPLPADTAVAFGSFAAARGSGSPYLTFLATWCGNVAGAMAMYGAGRRFGADRLARRLGGGSGASAQARIAGLYERYGVWALVLSRFLPGVRAVVPPVAGALRVPAWQAALAIGAASAVWYGGVTWLAYQAGANFEDVLARLKTFGWAAAAVAAAIALVVAAVVYARRRRR
jgi:membrane protein DedA with SNARE-associated domain